MKKTKLLLAPLLMIMGLTAKPLEIDNINRINKNVKTGTTLGHYQKPGAPINMSYRSTTVDANEVADINISLSTSVQTGSMSVTISFDDELKHENSISKEITFELSPDQKKLHD